MKNKRKWIRFPHEVGAVDLLFDVENRRSAVVVDESFGGISILLRDISGIEVDAEVVVKYRSFELNARVCYIADPSEDDGGKRRVGLKWLSPNSK